MNVSKWRLLMLTVAALMQLHTAAGVTKKLELEDYNEWNLPFATTISVAQYDQSSSRVIFPTGSYKLEIDPQAYFSIVFVDTSLY